MGHISIPFVSCADNLVTRADAYRAWEARVALFRDKLARSFIEEAGDLATAWQPIDGLGLVWYNTRPSESFWRSGDNRNEKDDVCGCGRVRRDGGGCR